MRRHCHLRRRPTMPLLDVVKRPVVAIIATGDELVAPGGTPGPDQIIASNSFGVRRYRRRRWREGD